MERSLSELVQALHEARKAEDAARKSLSDSRLAWELQTKPLSDAQATAINARVAAEDAVRAAGAAEYARTGKKDVAPGLLVKVMTRLVYAPEKALAWALEHKMALSLDKKAFESIAKTTPIDFVEKKEEPQVTIATDLGKVLEGSK